VQISVTSPLVTIYCVFENNYIVLIIRLLVRSYDKEHLPKRNKKMHNNVGKGNNNKMLNKIPHSEQLKNLIGKSKKEAKSIHLTQISMTAHFPCLIRANQYKTSGGVKLIL